MQIEHVSTTSLRPYANNARTHSRAQIKQIAASITRFGFTNPILIGDDDQVIAGHGRLAAAKLLKMEQVPVVRLSRLNAEERRAYILADNAIAQKAGWDQELLAIEFQHLIDTNFDMDLTGFSMAEIDLTLDAANASSVAPDKDDLIPNVASMPVTRAGDLWVLGRHLLICGDARDPAVYCRLMGDTCADLLFTDPPYNVPVHGHVCGNGSVKHREFAFASGEMSNEEFKTFLATALGCAALFSTTSALAYVFMDWRHMRQLMDAGDIVFHELKQLCVWNKTNGGQGAFYRSKHELVFVYQVGTEAPLNNFGLGETRYRTNVWDYARISSISPTRAADLAMHPTVKPLKLVVDAIEDCTRRGNVVLDIFAGSGTTLIAADRCGRIARAIEYDPLYCDVIIRRFQNMTGKGAVLAGTTTSFDRLSDERLGVAA